MSDGRDEVLGNDDQDVGVDMPVDWPFSGFITCALLGPIVPSSLIPYRSEIMMPTLPPTVPGDTTNGRAMMRQEKLISKSLKMNSGSLIQVVSQEEQW